VTEAEIQAALSGDSLKPVRPVVCDTLKARLAALDSTAPRFSGLSMAVSRVCAVRPPKPPRPDSLKPDTSRPRPDSLKPVFPKPPRPDSARPRPDSLKPVAPPPPVPPAKPDSGMVPPRDPVKPVPPRKPAHPDSTGK
jgi:hypothetical protein